MKIQENQNLDNKKIGSFRYQNKRPTVKKLHTKSPLRLVITAKLMDSPHIGPV